MCESSISDVWKKFARKKPVTVQKTANTRFSANVAETAMPLTPYSAKFTEHYEDGLVLNFDFTQIKDTRDIFNAKNPYGYQINVNHPAILPLYIAYKAFAHHDLLGDNERADFEKRVIRAVSAKT